MTLLLRAGLLDRAVDVGLPRGSIRGLQEHNRPRDTPPCHRQAAISEPNETDSTLNGHTELLPSVCYSLSCGRQKVRKSLIHASYVL